MEKNKEPARKKTVSTQFGLVVQIKWRVEIEYVSVLFMLVKPFVKFALRRFLLRWQPTERSDKGVGRCLSWRSRRARFYSFAVHLSRSQTTQLADCDCCSTYLKKCTQTLKRCSVTSVSPTIRNTPYNTHKFSNRKQDCIY